MIDEEYKGYNISALPVKTPSGKWSVSVTVTKPAGNEFRSGTFFAEDGIEYILQIEAAKEALNLGKNMINRGRIGF